MSSSESASLRRSAAVCAMARLELAFQISRAVACASVTTLDDDGENEARREELTDRGYEGRNEANPRAHRFDAPSARDLRTQPTQPHPDPRLDCSSIVKILSKLLSPKIEYYYLEP